MHIAVNTPEEKIGRTVTYGLLDNRARVTILGRRSRRLAMAVGKGARLVEGALDDEKTLRQALTGCDTLFWATPMVSRPDLQQWAVRTAERAAVMARECGIQRVVNVSSAGAPGCRGVGMGSALQKIENVFRRHCRNTVILRPCVIMENTLGDFSRIHTRQSLELPLHSHKPLPMVAAQDVGQVAVEYLLNTAWCGHLTIGVSGPKDVTPAEAAEIISTETGTPVAYRRTTLAETRQDLRAAGTTNYETEILLEKFQSIDEGSFDPQEPRVSHATMPTHLAEVVRSQLKTAMAERAK